jgi:hypothetical protein
MSGSVPQWLQTAENVGPALLQEVIDFLHFLFPGHPNLPGLSSTQIAAAKAAEPPAEPPAEPAAEPAPPHVGE